MSAPDPAPPARDGLRELLADGDPCCSAQFGCYRGHPYCLRRYGNLWLAAVAGYPGLFAACTREQLLSSVEHDIDLRCRVHHEVAPRPRPAHGGGV